MKLDIDEIQLRRLDLTVLLVFINLLSKASDVADHMGFTQSSISHSIKSLRDAFGDPLFLRTPMGTEPIAVAQGLEPKIRSVVETLSQAISTPVVFDPASSTDTLHIGAFDNDNAGAAIFASGPYRGSRHAREHPSACAPTRN